MEQNDEFYELAGSIQKECHDFVEQLMEAMDKKRATQFQNQDAINIFFYKKLADIELRLRELERRTTINYN